MVLMYVGLIKGGNGIECLFSGVKNGATIGGEQPQLLPNVP